MKHIIVILVAAMIIFAPVFAGAITLPRIKPNCNPAISPSRGGCGINDFMQLLRNIINFLLIIIIPIASGVIIWGGIVIMTAGGSSSRVENGKKIITTAIIGVAIALGFWVIINGVYLILTGASGPATI